MISPTQVLDSMRCTDRRTKNVIFRKKLYVKYKHFVAFVADPACTANVRILMATPTGGGYPWTLTDEEATAATVLSASETAWT